MRRLLSWTLLVACLFVLGVGFFPVAVASEERSDLTTDREDAKDDSNQQGRSAGQIPENRENDIHGLSDAPNQTPQPTRDKTGSSGRGSSHHVPSWKKTIMDLISPGKYRNPLIEFEDVINHSKVPEEYILRKLPLGTYLATERPTVSVTEGDSAHRGIIEDFKRALEEKYGYHVIEDVFSSFNQEPLQSALTIKTIRQVISEAEERCHDQTPLKSGGRNLSSVESPVADTNTMQEGGARRRSQRFRLSLSKNQGTPLKSNPYSKALDLVASEDLEKSRGWLRERSDTIAEADRLRTEGTSDLNAIEQNREVQLNEIQKEYDLRCQAITKAARNHVRGIPSVIYVQNGKDKELTKKELTKQKKDKQVKCFFESELRRNKAQKQIIDSFLLRRCFILDPSYNNYTDNSLRQINEIAVDLFISMSGKENLPYEISCLTIETMRVAEAIQFFVLGYETQNIIDVAKKNLIQAKSLVIEDIDYSQGGLEELFKSTQQLLDSASVSFHFAEAQSPRVATAMAEKNATTIQKTLDSIKVRITRNESIKASSETSASYKTTTTKKIEDLSRISESLQTAVFAYEQLRDENEIEKITGPLLSLKEKIEARILELSPKSPNSESISLIFSALNNLHKIFMPLAEKLEKEHSQPQNPSEFLDELNRLTEYQNSDKIIGANGKIALLEDGDTSSASSSSALDNISEVERKSYREGIDLIRLGLCRNFNIRAVERFDEEFKDQFKGGNSLRVGELKEFIEREKMLHESSHFLSPPNDIEDFIERLNRAEKNKVVKWDERTMKFNPFAGELAGIEEGDPLDINKKEIADGRAQARNAIANIFAADSVPEAKITEILARFDAEFPPINVESQTRIGAEELEKLTVGKLRSFINSELKGTNLNEPEGWGTSLTRERINALIMGGFSGLGGTVVAHIANNQFSAAALSGIGVSSLALIPPLLYLNYLRTREAAPRAERER